MGDLFEFKGIKQAKSQKLIPTDTSKEGIPYVVQSLSNNMVARNVNKKWLIDNKEPPINGNCIVLGVTLPAVSYQGYEFGASQVITARAKWLNPRLGNFITSLVEKIMHQFSYSHKPGIEIYKKIKIQLPTKNGEIDFDFMENFIAELEAERLAELEAYLSATGLKDTRLTAKEQQALADFENLTFSEFNINNLFEKAKLKTLKKPFDKLKDTSTAQTKAFSLPLVNAKVGDNGIMFYGRDEDFESTDMSIGVISNGAIATGTVYAQPQKTGVLWDAYLLKSKEKNMNREKLLFLTAALQKSIKLKFSWSYKAVWSKVKDETVQLPTRNQQPDYEQMETFIRAVQKLVIKDVVAYTDKKIAATNHVINQGG